MGGRYQSYNCKSIQALILYTIYTPLNVQLYTYARGIDDPAQLKATKYDSVELDIFEEGKKYNLRVQSAFMAVVKLMHSAENPPEITAAPGTKYRCTHVVIICNIA